ncbi:MAG TPA: hypothetical protein VIH59_11340 [Candidatus Tectomicrobia bacterium]
MFDKRITLFTLLGFAVRVDLSWLLIAALVTWSLAAGVFPREYQNLPRALYWGMGVAGMVGLFASIIVHELVHSLVARHYGLPMQGGRADGHCRTHSEPAAGLGMLKPGDAWTD